MYFNRLSQQQDSLYHDALSMCNINDTSQFPLVQFCRSANDWYRKANTWISQASGTWQFDDRNWTAILSTNTDLVAGTEEYQIPLTIRKVDRIEVLDDDGDYHPITPLDKSQIKGTALSELYTTDGFPKYYDLAGQYLHFYPTPAAGDITTTDGLKWFFTRDIKPFAITDTATEPGIDNHFHRIISFGTAYDYLLANGEPDSQRQILNEIDRLKGEIKEHYGDRHADMRPSLTPRDDNCL